MDIEKNIAAMLDQVRRERRENLSEFSAHLGIPLSTLQGYLKGSSSPRTDTLEELARKLEMTPAELVSGRRAPGAWGVSCLDLAPLEIAALHPDARPLAEEAVAVLRTAFRISHHLRAVDLPPEPPEGTRAYLRWEMPAARPGAPEYGLLVKERRPEGWVPVAVVASFSSDGEGVDRLARRCTELQLSPIHLVEVIQDFLAQEHWAAGRGSSSGEA